MQAEAGAEQRWLQPANTGFMSSIYTIRELTAILRHTLESAFPFVWVRGQVSNLSRPSSGHLYFSLKDDEASLAAVWFKGQQQSEETFDPLTGEVYEGGPRSGMAETLENGQEVICAGRLSVYAPRGSYQMVVELMQAAGKGRLQIEFERLKAELAAKGYFEQSRKRALPQYPHRVAVITSPSGAAVHDFLRIAQTRGLPAGIRIYPSLVQGDEAPKSIAAAFAQVEREAWAELAVLIRGGGSLEDLWAFNTREVTEAVYNCAIPVLCGVGHEVDVTLADLVADLRAATPSHAAQLLFKERREFAQAVDEADMNLQRALKGRIALWEQQLALQEKSLSLLSPAGRLEKAEIALAAERRRLDALAQGVLGKAQHALERYGDAQRMALSMRHILDATAARLDNVALRLYGADPNLPLERGYALVRRPDGSFLRSRFDAKHGDSLDILLKDGAVPVLVNEKGEKP